jgi:hypothetical protein
MSDATSAVKFQNHEHRHAAAVHAACQAVFQ